MCLIRGTSPTHYFTLPTSADNYQSIKIIYTQEGNILLTKDKSDLTWNEDLTIGSLMLTVEETLLFKYAVDIRLYLYAVTAEGISDISCCTVVPVINPEFLDLYPAKRSEDDVQD